MRNNKDAYTVMSRLLTGLETSLGLNVSGDVPARFASINRLCSNREISSEVMAYSAYINSLNKSRVSRYTGSDLKEFVITNMFVSLARGMAGLLTGNDPKVHHWVPVAFLRGYEINDTVKPKKVRTRIPAVVTNSHARDLNVFVDDAEFTHNVDSQNNGYYDMAIEFFFSKIESAFSMSKHKRACEYSKYDLVTLATFFVAQSVRNPHPSAGFTDGSINSIVYEIISNLNHFDEMHLSVTKMYAAPFTPYMPTRVRRLVGGRSIICFPFDANSMLSMSNGIVSAQEVRVASEAHTRYIISSARKTNGIIYGLTDAKLEKLSRM